MKFTHLFAFLFVSASLAFVACKKDQEIISPETVVNQSTDLSKIQASVQSGLLVFSNNDAFSKAVEIMNTVSPESATHWANSLGFESAEMILLNAEGQIEQGEKIDEMANQFPEVLTVEANSLELKVPNVLSRIVNAEGLVKIGGALYKFTENSEFVSLDGSMEKLNQAVQTQSSLEGAYYFFDNTQTVAVERACGYIIYDQTLVNSSNNRRSILSHSLTLIHTHQGDGLWTAEHFVEVRGRAQKKNIFGDWSNYNTNHAFDWNFRLAIANRQLLLTSGATISLELMNHSGSKTEGNSWITSYNAKFFKATNIPTAALPYSNPLWDKVYTDRHNHQGMNGAWNTYICG